MSSVALKVWPTAVVSNRRMEKTLSVSAFIPSETSGPGRQILAGPGRPDGHQLRKLSLITEIAIRVQEDHEDESTGIVFIELSWSDFHKILFLLFDF